MNENNELNNNATTPVTPVAPVEPTAPVTPVEQPSVQPVEGVAPVETPVQSVPEGAPVLPTDNAQTTPAQPTVPVEPVTSVPQGDNTTSSDSNDKLFGIISYLGFLSLIVLYVIKPKSDFALFHAKQGANLFIIELIISIFGSVITYVLRLAHVPFAGTLVSLASTAVWILSLIGLIYAAQGIKKELPVVSAIKIFK